MSTKKHISSGQLFAVLLCSRMASILTFSPPKHQQTHGLDFVLSIIIQAGIMAVLIIPAWWFSKRTGEIGLASYCMHSFGRAGWIIPAFYGMVCIYIQVIDLTRYSKFFSTSITADLTAPLLCAALMVSAAAAAFYGLQAIARSAAVIAAFVLISVVLISIALIPGIELINYPAFLYDGMKPVFEGVLEILPRSFEAAVIVLLFPHIKGGAAKGYLWWCAAIAAVAAIVQLCSVGVLGDFAAMQMFPYYMAVTAAPGSILHRLDIVSAAIWIAALFLRTSFYAMIFVDCFEMFIGKGWRAVILIIGTAAALLAGLIIGDKAYNNHISDIISIISGVLIFICAVLIPSALALKSRRNADKRMGAVL